MRPARRRDTGHSDRGVPGLFVTGTDTGVGKTVVAAAIVALCEPRAPRSEH